MIRLQKFILAVSATVLGFSHPGLAQNARIKEPPSAAPTINNDAPLVWKAQADAIGTTYKTPEQLMARLRATLKEIELFVRDAGKLPFMETQFTSPWLRFRLNTDIAALGGRPENLTIDIDRADHELRKVTDELKERREVEEFVSSECLPWLSKLGVSQDTLTERLFYFDAMGQNRDFKVRDFACYFYSSPQFLSIHVRSAGEFQMRFTGAELTFRKVSISGPINFIETTPTNTAGKDIRFALTNVETRRGSTIFNTVDESIQVLMSIIQSFGRPPLPR